MTACCRFSACTACATCSGSSGSSGSRAAGLDVAEAAVAGAGIAEDEEGGGAVAPALADVGAVGLFAHGVQVLGAHQPPEPVVRFASGGTYPQPGRAALGLGQGLLCPGVDIGTATSISLPSQSPLRPVGSTLCLTRHARSTNWRWISRGHGYQFIIHLMHGSGIRNDRPQACHTIQVRLSVALSSPLILPSSVR